MIAAAVRAPVELRCTAAGSAGSRVWGCGHPVAPSVRGNWRPQVRTCDVDTGGSGGGGGAVGAAVPAHVHAHQQVIVGCGFDRRRRQVLNGRAAMVNGAQSAIHQPRRSCKALSQGLLLMHCEAPRLVQGSAAAHSQHLQAGGSPREVDIAAVEDQAVGAAQRRIVGQVVPAAHRQLQGGAGAPSALR